MNPLIQLKQTTSVFLIGFGLAWFGLSPAVQALSPAPDGGYPNFTTAEGDKTLFSVTTGAANTGLGWRSLFLNSSGNFNTGVGAGTLVLNTADSNTAVGAAALLLNTTGTQNVAVGTAAFVHNDSGSGNNAVGAFALSNNTDGFTNNAVGNSALLDNIHGHDNTAIGDLALSHNDSTGSGLGNDNTAVGSGALFTNTDGDSNTAVGFHALLSNTTGPDNTATGDNALFSNTTGILNVATGSNALSSNTDGGNNTATGANALASNTDGSANTATGQNALNHNTTGNSNTAVGFNALISSTTGLFNAALGIDAGDNVMTASGVTCIGANVPGADVDNTTWIANVYGVTTQNGLTAPVIVSADGQLGTAASSERFKKDIASMEKASQAILSLRPVTFHYKSDVKDFPQFGLIAEEVAKVNPALVLPDKEGKPYTVRYDAVNAMLLNEFLKEHKKVEEQQATITQLKKDFGATIAQLTARLDEQAAQIQKVSTQLAAASPSGGGLEASKFAIGRIRRGGPAPQVVNNP
jgi:hypothetical protein